MTAREILYFVPQVAPWAACLRRYAAEKGEKERMRTDRNARLAGGTQTGREGGNAGSQAAARNKGSEPGQIPATPGSSDPLDRARARRLAAQVSLPEIRGERIAAIQRAIAEGTYQASPEQTAEAIISEQQIWNGTAA